MNRRPDRRRILSCFQSGLVSVIVGRSRLFSTDHVSSSVSASASVSRFSICGGFSLAGAPRDLLLYLLEGDPVNNCRVAVVYIVFRELALVLHAFAGEDVLNVRLLQERVADVFLVLKHTLNRAVGPLLTAADCSDSVCLQVFTDFSDAVANEISGKDAPDDSGLLLVDLRLTVWASFVTEETLILIVDLTLFKVPAMPPTHISAEGLTLRLGL